MIIDRIVLDDGNDHDDDDDGGDVQHAGVIPVNGIPSFPAPVRQPEHAEQAHAYHAFKQTYHKRMYILQKTFWNDGMVNGFGEGSMGLDGMTKFFNGNQAFAKHLFVVNQRSGLICINA